LKAGDVVRLNSEGLGYWETIHVADLATIITDFLKSYSWSHLCEVFNISYGRETDFIETVQFIERKVQRGQLIMDGAKGYKTFYLSNEKIKNVVPFDVDYFDRLGEYINTTS
jgi:dTDP-D-glucose 4,6-dehydratase